MAKAIMIQGTMSNAGKSLLTAGLCRIFKQDGYRVAPFKSQNMALNSFITREGLEMGRAQVVQAQAAGVEPSVAMNPILLKPSSDTGSQVIVNGAPIGTMAARDYFRYKKELIPVIWEAYERLNQDYDIIVIEGAGSPAEINLKQNDIVNMGMAKMAGAPVLLVGDIDRGGVFAQLYGTVMLLEQEERARIKGMIINKFRGDKSLLDSGVELIEEKLGIPVVGVTPYLAVDIEDEDSLSSRIEEHSGAACDGGESFIDIAVIRFPRLSNFTDLGALERIKGLKVRYVSREHLLGTPDLVILPGTKNTVEDLLWMRQSGLEAAVLKLASGNTPVFGICGGYQMMGSLLLDVKGTESGRPGTVVKGMGLFDLVTEFEEEKTRTRVEGRFLDTGGVFECLTGVEFAGYEIHMGRTCRRDACVDGHMGERSDERLEEHLGGGSESHLSEGREKSLVRLWTDRNSPSCDPSEAETVNEKTEKEEAEKEDGFWKGNCYGTYVHGIFDSGAVAAAVVRALAEAKGLDPHLLAAGAIDYDSYRETQFDLLADGLRANLDMAKIYEILENSVEQ